MNRNSDGLPHDGSPERPMDHKRDSHVPFFSLLPDDFPERLERLREASGLTWSGMARAIGVSHKQIYRWRKGVEPCGGALQSLYEFADSIPGGLAILLGKDHRTTCCRH